MPQPKACCHNCVHNGSEQHGCASIHNPLTFSCPNFKLVYSMEIKEAAEYQLTGVYSDKPKPKEFLLKLEQGAESVVMVAVDSTGKKLRSGDLLSIKYDRERERWYVFLHSGINDELPLLFGNDHTIHTKSEHSKV